VNVGEFSLDSLKKPTELVTNVLSSTVTTMYNSNANFKQKIADLIQNDNFKELIQEISLYEKTLVKDNDFQHNLHYLNGIKLYVLINSINDQLFSEFLKKSKKEVSH